MPRVKRVKKARINQPNCGKCGCEIKRGDSYTFWVFRVNVGKAFRKDRRTRCAKPDCQPKPKDLTKSEFWGAIYELQERKFDAESIEDLEGERDDVVNELTNIKDETEGKLDGMPEGLKEGNTGQILQERIDALDGCINDLESTDISWEEPEKEKGEKKEAYETRKEEELSARLQEISDELQSHLSNISCS